MDGEDGDVELYRHLFSVRVIDMSPVPRNYRALTVVWTMEGRSVACTSMSRVKEGRAAWGEVLSQDIDLQRDEEALLAIKDTSRTVGTVTLDLLRLRTAGEKGTLKTYATEDSANPPTLRLHIQCTPVRSGIPLTARAVSIEALENQIERERDERKDLVNGLVDGEANGGGECVGDSEGGDGQVMQSPDKRVSVPRLDMTFLDKRARSATAPSAPRVVGSGPQQSHIIRPRAKTEVGGASKIIRPKAAGAQSQLKRPYTVVSKSPSAPPSTAASPPMHRFANTTPQRPSTANYLRKSPMTSKLRSPSVGSSSVALRNRGSAVGASLTNIPSKRLSVVEFGPNGKVSSHALGPSHANTFSGARQVAAAVQEPIQEVDGEAEGGSRDSTVGSPRSTGSVSRPRSATTAPQKSTPQRIGRSTSSSSSQSSSLLLMKERRITELKASLDDTLKAKKDLQDEVTSCQRKMDQMSREYARKQEASKTEREALKEVFADELRNLEYEFLEAKRQLELERQNRSTQQEETAKGSIEISEGDNVRVADLVAEKERLVGAFRKEQHETLMAIDTLRTTLQETEENLRNLKSARGSQVSTLEDEILELRGRVSNCSSKVARGDEALKMTKKELNDVKEENSQLERLLEECQFNERRAVARVEALEGDVESLTVQLSEAKELLDSHLDAEQATFEANHLDEEIQRQADRNEQLRRAIEESTARLQLVKKENKSLQQSLEEVRQDLSEVKQNSPNTSTAAESTIGSTHELESRIRSLEAMLEMTNSKYEERSNELEDTKLDLIAVTEERDLFEKEVETLQKQVDQQLRQFNQQTTELKTRLMEQYKKVQNDVDTLDELENKLAVSERRRSIAEESLMIKRESDPNLTKSVEAGVENGILRKKVEELTAVETRLQDRCSELQRTRDRKDEEIAGLKGDLERLQNERAGYIDRIEVLEAAVQKGCKEMESIETEMTSLRDERMHVLRMQIDEAERAASLQDVLERLRHEKKALEDELSDLRPRFVEVSMEKANALSEVDVLAKELSQLKERQTPKPERRSLFRKLSGS